MKRALIRASATASAVLLLAIAAFSGDHSDLRFVVLRETTGKPVRNASVIMHRVEKDGRASGAGLQLKTDNDGKAGFNSVPYGKLRVQVIAHGFQTFGNDFEINQPAQEIVIKLKPPKEQYSIYK